MSDYQISEENRVLLKELSEKSGLPEEELLDKAVPFLPALLKLLEDAGKEYPVYEKRFKELIPSEDGFLAPMCFRDFSGEDTEGERGIIDDLREVLAAAYVLSLSEEKLDDKQTATIIESAVVDKL